MGKYEGNSRVALKPQNTEQVSQILQHCNANRIAVVPQVTRSDCRMMQLGTQGCMLICLQHPSLGARRAATHGGPVCPDIVGW